MVPRSAVYLRFVCAERHPESGRRMGLFACAYRLRRADALEDPDRDWCNDVLEWFGDNLAAPRRLYEDRAIFWFKHTARVHVTRMRELAVILERYGAWSRVLRTRKP